MSIRSSIFALVVFIVATLCGFTAVAGNSMKTQTVDGMRLELQVLPAEPFFTANEVKANHNLKGMMIMGGAKPLAPDAHPRPDRHLVVHVYNAKTGRAIPDAEVSIKFQSLDKRGQAHGPAVEVPVVIMEIIGKGPQSTHFGNNVVMSAGRYAVTVVANGKKANFHIIVSNKKVEKMNM